MHICIWILLGTGWMPQSAVGGAGHRGRETRELSSVQVPAYLQCTGLHICTDSG